MADISIDLKDYLDTTGSGITVIAPMAVVTIDTNRFACASDRINLTLNSGYVEMSVEGRNIYRYTVGDTYASVPKTASQMFSEIQLAISKP